MAIILKKCEILLHKIHPFLSSHGLLTGAYDLSRVSDIAVGVLQTDSRKLNSGDIFLAYKGVASDGHHHLKNAISKGVSFLIVEDRNHLSGIPNDKIPPWIEVKNGRATWSALASLAYGHPQKSLKIAAVTGTNGKTSTVWMTSELLRASGIPCLTIGTLGARLGDEEFSTNHTTPDPDTLFALLAYARDSGVKLVAMEVSSHALVQDKVRDLLFNAAAFTSFSRDHLDFHPSMEAYWDAKWSLFTKHMTQDSACIFSGSLPKLDLKSLNRPSFVYGFNDCQIVASENPHRFLYLQTIENLDLSSELIFTIENLTISATVPFFAKHALENLAAAFLLFFGLMDKFPSSEALRQVRPVPGRLEAIRSVNNGPQIVVDYAHTPDALEKTLEVLRPVCGGNLIVVFGCGGDRDKGKRPLMGQIAEDKADIVIITSDNPRTENPDQIINEILIGLKKPTSAFIVLDRREAIVKAINMATHKDVILIAGKGHETYQIIGNTTFPFDDRKVAKDALAQWETKV